MNQPYSIFPNKQIHDLLQYVPTPSLFKRTDNEFIFWACPFEVGGGAIYQTEAGLKPLDAHVNDYTSLQRVILGNSAFIVIWKNSYTLHQDLGDPLVEHSEYDNYGYKTWKIGTAFKGVVVNEALGSQFLPFSGNQSFISQQITKSISLRFYNIAENQDLFNNLDAYGIHLWVLPNFAVGKYNKNPFDDESRTFFEVNNMAIERQPDRTIAYVDIEFISLNNKIAKTGIAINQFVQLGGAGEPFAFPVIDKYNNLKIDQERTTPNPVTHFQIQFLGLTAFGGINFRGRPVYEADIKDTADYNIYPETFLFPYQWQRPVNNLISLKSYPSNTYYWMKAFALDVVKTKTTSQTFNVMYNNFTPKQVSGYIHTDYKATQSTNSSTPLVYYDADFLTDKAIWEATQKITSTGTAEVMKWSIVGNANFVYPKPNSTEYLTTIKGADNNFDYSQVPNNADVTNGFAHWNMFNMLLNKTQIELPLEYTDYTKVDAVNLPIVGSLFRDLTFGFLGDGWSFSTTNIPKFPYFNCLMPITNYNAYAKLWVSYFKDSLPTADGFLGFETFYEGDQDGLGLITGSNAVTMGFAASLTHMGTFEGTKLDGTGAITKNLAWSDTRMLLKNIFNNTDYVFLPNEKTRLKDYLTASDNPYYMRERAGNVIGYMIDFLQFLAVGRSPYQIKFFNMSGYTTANKKALKDKFCVWMGTFNTQAKAQNNIRSFRNTQMLSDPLFNFKSRFRYPKDLLPIPPTGKTQFTTNIVGGEASFILINTTQSVGNEHPTVLCTGQETFNDLSFPSLIIPHVVGFKISEFTLNNVSFNTIYNSNNWKYETTFDVGQNTTDFIKKITFFPNQKTLPFDVIVHDAPTISLPKRFNTIIAGRISTSYFGVSLAGAPSDNARMAYDNLLDNKTEWKVPFSFQGLTPIVDPTTQNLTFKFSLSQYTSTPSKNNLYRVFQAVYTNSATPNWAFDSAEPPIQMTTKIELKIKIESITINYLKV